MSVGGIHCVLESSFHVYCLQRELLSKKNFDGIRALIGSACLTKPSMRQEQKFKTKLRGENLKAHKRKSLIFFLGLIILEIEVIL